jgi:ABC-type transport system substrate-binding protein
MVEVEANPNYFLDKPLIERGILKFSRNASLPELLSGNVDALTMAINRQELSEVLNYPDNVPISDVICTSRQRNSLGKPDPLPYNPEAALKLLKECGWD